MTLPLPLSQDKVNILESFSSFLLFLFLLYFFDREICNWFEVREKEKYIVYGRNSVLADEEI